MLALTAKDEEHLVKILVRVDRSGYVPRRETAERGVIGTAQGELAQPEHSLLRHINTVQVSAHVVQEQRPLV